VSTRKELSRWLSEIDGGTVVLPSKITMRDLCHRWLDDEVASESGYSLSIP
jgi:hypothetical protein